MFFSKLKLPIFDKVKNQVELMSICSDKSSTPQTLFQALTFPMLAGTNRTINFIGLFFAVFGLLFIVYRIRRRKRLNKIENIKKIKELP